MFLQLTTGVLLVDPEVEAGNNDGAAGDGGHGGALPQDEKGQQHVENRRQAPDQQRVKSADKVVLIRMFKCMSAWEPHPQKSYLIIKFLNRRF